jgi:hypothetical protein
LARQPKLRSSAVWCADPDKTANSYVVEISTQFFLLLLRLRTISPAVDLKVLHDRSAASQAAAGISS